MDEYTITIFTVTTFCSDDHPPITFSNNNNITNVSFGKQQQRVRVLLALRSRQQTMVRRNGVVRIIHVEDESDPNTRTTTTSRSDLVPIQVEDYSHNNNNNNNHTKRNYQSHDWIFTNHMSRIQNTDNNIIGCQPDTNYCLSCVGFEREC
jgi:hypothetical protein